MLLHLAAWPYCFILSCCFAITPYYFTLKYIFSPCCSTLLIYFDVSPYLLFYALILLDYYSPPSLPFFHIGLGMVNFKLSSQSLVSFSPFFFLFFKRKFKLFVKFFHFVYMFCLLSLHCCFPPPPFLCFSIILLKYFVSCAKVFVY
jgi:hypothetical protein